MNSTVLFLLASGGVAAIIYWMTTRLGNSHRGSAYDGASSGGDYGNSGSGVGWLASSWFGGGSSSHEAGSSSDSGGGSDGGGGGGDGGGGGGGD